MLWGARTDSAIMDELAHIPAGYGYISRLDYRLNPEHPPLVKALAALPLLLLGPNFPTQSSAWTTDINGQWAMGAQFLYESGNDANQIVRWARIVPILLTILLVVLIYFWSRELLGNWWSLLPTLLFALSPTLLAHGHYVTTDVGAAFGIIFATYYFLKFLYEPSRRRLVYAGLAFGVAEIAKFSTALLVPYFVLLLSIFYIIGVARDWEQTETGKRLRRFALRGLRYIKAIVFIFVVGYALIVYPVYFLFTLNQPIQKQAADTQFILTSFAGGPTPSGQPCHIKRCPADLTIWMSKHEITRPLAQYTLGVLMTLQRSAGGNTGYFLGEVSAAGSHIYFPLVYLMKEPLPVLIMVFVVLLSAIWNALKAIKNRGRRLFGYLRDYVEVNFTEFSFLVFITIYWTWSIISPLNIGFRHLLPTLPLIYILTARVWKGWIAKVNVDPAFSGLRLLFAWFKNILSASMKYLFLVLLVVWFLAETAFAAPHFLSYLNELGGGIWGGYHYVTDSNYDWGQDLLRLQDFVAAHPEVDKIAVDYFGGGNPQYYLGDASTPLGAGTSTQLGTGKEVDWWSSRGNPVDQRIHWLAVSVNTLQGAIQPLANGQQRKPEDGYGWLTALRPPAPGLGNVPVPDYRAGTSIFIYKL